MQGVTMPKVICTPNLFHLMSLKHYCGINKDQKTAVIITPAKTTWHIGFTACNQLFYLTSSLLGSSGWPEL